MGSVCHGGRRKQKLKIGESGLIGSQCPSTEDLREKSYCCASVKAFPEAIFNAVALLRQALLVHTAIWSGDEGTYFIGASQGLNLSGEGSENTQEGKVSG